MDHDPVRQRVLEVDHGVERLERDVHRLDGVAGDGVTRRQHGDDAVSGVADLARRQRVVGRVLHVLGHRPGARHRRRPGIGEVGAGVHGDDARDGLGRRRVDADDAGVGVRAADDGHVQRTRDVQVGGEAGFARQEGRILAAQPALPDDPGCRCGVGHRHRAPPEVRATERQRRSGRTRPVCAEGSFERANEVAGWPGSAVSVMVPAPIRRRRRASTASTMLW